MPALSSPASATSTSDPAHTARPTGAGGMLDRCRLGGSWLVLTFRQIANGTATDPTHCSVADFQTIMAVTNSRNIPVLPVGDVLRTYL
ncbi:hypothetical protein [Streptomyces enissocaesilis]